MTTIEDLAKTIYELNKKVNFLVYDKYEILISATTFNFYIKRVIHESLYKYINEKGYVICSSENHEFQAQVIKCYNLPLKVGKMNIKIWKKD